MRTTLSIDDDLAESVEKMRTRRNLSQKDAINQLLRAGLRTLEKSTTALPYSGPVFDGGLRPGIDPNRMNQLADELEIDEVVS